MIDTIFYFPSSLTFEEYTSQLQSGDISERTIVFADEQKSIYKGGKKYGGWSTQEFHEKMSEYENYDDSWINDELNGIKQDILGAKNRIDGLNDLIAGINNRLNSDVDGIGDDIKSKIESLFEDQQWIEDHFPERLASWDSGWNLELEAYLTLVGYWEVENGVKTTKWSKLQLKIDALELSLNQLVTNGSISTALSASIQALISDYVAQLNLGTTYAKTEDVDDVHKVIEWLYSGLKSATDPNSTFAQLVSAASNQNGQNAISEVRTYVEKLKNGDYVAEADVAAKVGDTISTMLLQTANNNALAALAAKADTNSDNISALLLGMTGSTATADIQTRVSNALSGFISQSTLNGDIASAKSEIYSAISAKDGSDNFISLSALKTSVDTNTATLSALTLNGTNTSGFVTRAGLDDAVAEIFAATGNPNNYDAKASVVAYVKDNKSSLQLTANDVQIDGYLTGGGATFKGNVEATRFTTGSDSDSGISVITGTFDEGDASLNTNKAYFAYDQSQGAVTMWFYQNGRWKRIDLSQCAVVEPSTFSASVFYQNIATTARTFNLNNYSPITLYYNSADGKYYETSDTTTPANGTYYKVSEYRQLDSRYMNYPQASNETVNVDSAGSNCTSATAPAGYIDRYILNSGVKAAESYPCRAYLLYAFTSVYADRSQGTVARIIAKKANGNTYNDYVCLDGSVYSYPVSGYRTAYEATTFQDAITSPIDPVGYGRPFNFEADSSLYQKKALVTYSLNGLT